MKLMPGCPHLSSNNISFPRKHGDEKTGMRPQVGLYLGKFHQAKFTESHRLIECICYPVKKTVFSQIRSDLSVC